MRVEAFIGEIRLLPWEFETEDWMPCDGRLLQVDDHVALFALIGYRYGGEESMKLFALPEIDAPKGMQYAICTNGIFPIRKV